MSTISPASISRARRLSPATRSRPRRPRVLAFAGRIREIAGETDEGRRLAEAAFAMATELGLDELRAHALTTIGMAKNDVGLRVGRRPTWSAPSRSLSRPTPRLPRRSSTTSPSTRRLPATSRRTDELYAEAMRLGERYGDAASVRFVRGNRIWLDYMLGRWDRALESADDVHRRVRGGITAHAGAVRRAK